MKPRISFFSRRQWFHIFMFANILKASQMGLYAVHQSRGKLWNGDRFSLQNPADRIQ
jgi:hypothetical protein